MSTRAVYTFKDKDETVHVYKHHDGYPEGGISWITNTLKHAWPLPRFEANEFAAAFVATNKEGHGGIRLCATGVNEPYEMSADAEYHYVVTMKDRKLCVTVCEVDWWEDPKSTTIFDGSLADAIDKFKPEFLNAA